MKTYFSLILSLTLVACMPSKQLKQANSSILKENAAADSRVFTQAYDMRELDNGLKVIVVKTDYPGVVITSSSPNWF